MPRPYPDPIPDPPEPPLLDRLRAVRLQHQAEELAPYLRPLLRPPAKPVIFALEPVADAARRQGTDMATRDYTVRVSTAPDDVTARNLVITNASDGSGVLSVDLKAGLNVSLPVDVDVVLVLTDVNPNGSTPSDPFPFRATAPGGGGSAPPKPTILGLDPVPV